MERLAREKIATQQRLAELKNELGQCMDVLEIDRVLRQTVQPEEDQASTSTASGTAIETLADAHAVYFVFSGENTTTFGNKVVMFFLLVSEGEEIFDQDIDEDVSPPPPSSLRKLPPPILQTQPLLTSHLSIQHTALPLSGVLTSPPLSAGHPPQAIAPAPATHPLLPPSIQVQPTVIAHAAVSHPSVIQAVNHVLPAKHLTHIAPSPGPPSSTPQPMAATVAAHQPMTAQPIGHITVHPVAHIPSHLYPQGVSVSQPTVVGHITHTFTHVQANPHANADRKSVV